MISNYKNSGREFHVTESKKRNVKGTIHFEDGNFPAFIKSIRNVYGYTRIEKNKRRKRVGISLQEIKNHISIGSIEIQYEKDTKRCYLNLPVPVGFYLPDDKHCESQAVLHVKDEGGIALDPGIRTFLSGYSINDVVEIGDEAAIKIFDVLHKLDSTRYTDDNSPDEIENVKKQQRLLRAKVRDMIDDMHWKAIKYLTSNYKIIIYPDFRTKGMMKKLSKSNKRKIAALSFYKFKQRLIYKCKAEGCSLIIMNEAYTSRTCSCCGFLNPKSTSKAFECKSCKWAVDRDLNGARNIMLKTLCCLSSI